MTRAEIAQRLAAMALEMAMAAAAIEDAGQRDKALARRVEDFRLSIVRRGQPREEAGAIAELLLKSARSLLADLLAAGVASAPGSA